MLVSTIAPLPAAAEYGAAGAAGRGRGGGRGGDGEEATDPANFTFGGCVGMSVCVCACVRA